MSPQKYAGAFSVDAEAKEGTPLEKVEKGILAEIEKLKKEPVTAEELQKVKNNVAAAAFRHLSSDHVILFQLLIYDGYGDWREMNEARKKLAPVTTKDVQRVARRYLTSENQAVYLVTRRGSGAAPATEATK